MIELEFSLLCFMEVKWKARRQCVQKPARGPAEMLIGNKVLGFHNNPQVGRTAAPQANEPERERGQRTVHTHPPDECERKTEGKKTDRAAFSFRGAAPHLRIFVMILMKLSFPGRGAMGEALRLRRARHLQGGGGRCFQTDGPTVHIQTHRRGRDHTGLGIK